MTVDIYKGQFVSAESAYDYIDSEAIIKSARKIKEIASEVARASREVGYSKDYFTADSYYVYGETLIDRIERCESSLNKTANNLDDRANEILENLQKKLDIKQEELNEIAIENEKKITSKLEKEEKNEISGNLLVKSEKSTTEHNNSDSIDSLIVE